MAAPVNIFAMVHGMIPDRNPESPWQQYQDFWTALVQAEPRLDKLIPAQQQVGVEWGHELVPTPNPIRDDQQLTRAEAFVYDQVAYANVKADQNPNNVTIFDFGIPGVRQIVTSIREGVIIYGLTDVVYYCSAEGEQRVRSQVYKQILDKLEPFKDQPDVRLHLFGHSLGVALCHDFLYGLFNRNNTSDFVSQQQGDPKSVAQFKFWKAKAGKQLTLGSFAAAASQLPLLVMRKQSLITKLFNQQCIDPTDIGIQGQQIRWKIFYDIDDLLGFATRRLYSPNDAIMDI